MFMTSVGHDARKRYNVCRQWCCDTQTVMRIGRRIFIQKNARNPNHHYFSKKYRNTPPICIAIRLQFVPQHFWCPYALRKGKYCQYSPHLYHSTPPICIAIRLPFVLQYFWENLGGCGHRNVPHLYTTSAGRCCPFAVFSASGV